MVLSFALRDQGKRVMMIGLTAGQGLDVDIIPETYVDDEQIERVKDDLISAIRIIHSSIKGSTLHFVWVMGEKIVPEEMPTLGKRVIERLFSSALLLIYVLLFAFNIFLFLFVGLWAVVVVLLFQLLLVMFADRIYLRMGKWRITEENQKVLILRYRLSDEEAAEIRSRMRAGTLVEAKAEIYEKSYAIGKEPTCDLIKEVLFKRGIVCSPDSISSKVVNVHEIVRKATSAYDLPMPKVVISNSMLPNAAATGPSPKHGVVLITGGLLIDLNDDEVLSVVGHEIGHLKGRDPLILFGLMSVEFLLRVTILLPIFLFMPLIYLIIVFGLIFFIAKFFEARADLLSAMNIGQPKILAEALVKIGYQRLRYERARSRRLLSWLRWDPHPPIYFRIERLNEMETPVRTKHPFIRSVRDVISGLKAAL